MQDNLETLTAMRHREDVAYATNDWTGIPTNRPLHHESVDLDCRNQMAAWCFQVVDVCKLSHESIEITMSLVDRFLSTPQGTKARSDRCAFQLACMGALYTAVKIHEPQAMTPSLVSRLSNGAYSSSDIEEMERTLLEALQWTVNPPTAHCFTRHLMELLPQEILADARMKQVILDLTLLQIELSISNSLFVTANASSVAYASIMNAMESLGQLNDHVLRQVGTFFAQALHLHAQSVEEMQNVLYQALASSQRMTCPPTTPRRERRMSSLKDTTMGETSPRSIVYSQ